MLLLGSSCGQKKEIVVHFKIVFVPYPPYTEKETGVGLVDKLVASSDMHLNWFSITSFKRLCASAQSKIGCQLCFLVSP